VDGGARLSSDVSEIKIAFGIPPERPTPNFAASWNVAPTDPLPVVRYDGKDRQRSLEVMRWGLIPYWAKDDKIGFSTINARGRGGRHQAGVPRAVPPAPLPGAGREFLRMEKSAKGKQPYAVGLEDGGLMALAGLWDTWHSPAGERIRSFTIITTPPNDLGAGAP
jgi:putative SOS response-associated peptidase YedK